MKTAAKNDTMRGESELKTEKLWAIKQKHATKHAQRTEGNCSRVKLWLRHYKQPLPVTYKSYDLLLIFIYFF